MMLKLKNHYNIDVETDAEILEWFDAIGRRRGLLQNEEVDYRGCHRIDY